MFQRMGAAVLAVAAVCAIQPAAAQKSKDTLRMPIGQAESILDPYLSPGTFHYIWAPAVYDGLLAFDPTKVAFVPQLAKSWSQPDPTVYEFEVRDDVKWHDGQAFSVDDVVYTIGYLIDPKVNLRYKANWAWIKSVEKIGPNKVRITAKHPVPDGMMWLASSTPIYPKHLHEPLADKQDFGAKPIGTGPYHITKMDKNTGIFAEKFASFTATPMKPAAAIGKLVAEPIPDPGTQAAKLMTGEADAVRDLPVEQALALAQTGRFDVTLSPPTLGYTFLGIPTAGWQRVKALGDVRVRTAIAKAIDRKALLNVQFGALAKGMEPVEALCSKEQLGCGYTKLTPEYDPAGAKKLLAEAGYPDGFDVVISTFPQNATEATAVSGMLRAVGIRASVRTHPIANRVKMLADGQIDIGYYGWSGGSVFEVSGQIARHFQTKEYEDPDLTKMADDTMLLMNDAERRKAVAAVFDYTTDHAYAFPMLPNRVAFTHTKELQLTQINEMRAAHVAVNEFRWK
jgi:peptide/nickel transport system substrate-binding protein